MTLLSKPISQSVDFQKAPLCLYIDQNFLASGGHSFTSFQVLKSAIQSITKLCIVSPRYPFTLSDQEGESFHYPINKHPKSSPFFRKINAFFLRYNLAALQYILIMIAEIIDFPRSLLSLLCITNRFSVGSRLVYLSDPSLSLLIACLTLSRRFSHIVVQFIVMPSSPFSSRYSFCKPLLSVYSFLLRPFKNKASIIVDDERMLVSFSECNALCFPYCYQVAQPKACRASLNNPSIFLPGYLRGAKNPTATISALILIAKRLPSTIFHVYLQDQQVLKTLPLVEVSSFPVNLVVHQTGHLSYDQYVLHLEQANLVSLIYDNTEYSRDGTTSGILRESFYLGRPILVTKGSWMEMFLAAQSVGDILSANNEPQSIADTLMRFFDAESIYLNSYSLAAQSYRSNQQLCMVKYQKFINKICSPPFV